jgi:hypothetical protein
MSGQATSAKQGPDNNQKNTTAKTDVTKTLATTIVIGPN